MLFINFASTCSWTGSSAYTLNIHPERETSPDRGAYASPVVREMSAHQA